MKTIFLDIDGVLNSGRSFIAFAKNARSAEFENDAYWFKITKSTIDPVSVGLLNKVLEDFDARFVLSSSHRLHFKDGEDKLDKIQAFMSNLGVLGERCIGYTPYSNTIRGKEIAHWINDNKDSYPIEHMIILDDSSDFLPEQMEFHVHCKGGHGITEENYYDMTRLFGRADSGLVLI